MADVFSIRKRSEVMSRIRSRGNKDTELALARLLRAHKISGWRRQVEIRGRAVAAVCDRRKTSGAHRAPLQRPAFRVRPDFVFAKLKVAVFVDGCFWHGCPRHCSQPANNRAFWREKLAANRTRDRKVNRALRAAGWRVVRIWEHALARKREARLVAKLRKALAS